MRKKLRIIFLLLAFTALAFASTQGPLGGTGAGAGWGTPTNIASTNAAYATCTANNSACTTPLSSSTFGFTVPAGATINGITVAVVAHCSSTVSCDLTNTVSGTGICVTKVAATCTGTSKLDATTWGTTDQTFTYGSGADLWGTTWVVADVNATGFGVAMNPEVSVALNRTMSVDSVLVTVTFTPAGATSPSQMLKVF